MNPLELASGFVLLVLVRWWGAHAPFRRFEVPPQLLAAVVALVGLFFLTMVVARAVHHFAGVAFDPESLAASGVLQTALSIVWGVTGLTAMVIGARASARAIWLGGAALMAVVVVKLFLVELDNTGYAGPRGVVLGRWRAAARRGLFCARAAPRGSRQTHGIMRTAMQRRPTPSAAVVSCACLALGALSSGALALQHEQFAAGWPLELPSEEGFFDVPLTLEIYQQARRLEELAVLDLAGYPMPFYRVSQTPPTPSERRTSLAASPVYATDASAAELTVATDDQRTNVTVTRPADEAGPQIVAFILDARAIEAAPLALELEWRALAQPFLMEVRIEQSETLTEWRPVGRASIAQLSIDDTELRHGRVPVVAAQGGYYRITASGSVVDWYLESADLVSAATERPPMRVARFAPIAERPTETRAQDEAAAAETLYFDLGGRLPVTAVTVSFTAPNRWGRASLASSDSLEGPWRTHAGSRLFYELDYENENLASPDVELGRVEHRYWRAVFEVAPSPGAVELQVEYPQEHLRFYAAGVAPYMLVAGTVSPAAGPDTTLLTAWDELRPRGTGLQQATVGARVELGGAAALEEPFEFPWLTATLWLVLGGGVLGVAAMAFKLAREMRQDASR